MGKFWLWSKTAASNDTADPTVNYREGQAPSTLNNSGRAVMAALACFRDDISGALETGGANSAYTLATNSGVVDGSTDYLDNVCVAFVPHATNAATPTLNVDSGGALPLRGATGVALAAGVLIEGTPYVALLSADKTEWLIHGYRNEPTTIPLGGFLPYAADTAPNSNFILPYGQAISRSTYSALFTLISTTYGVGDGTTTFNVPDLRGRVVVGLDDMGSAANRVTTAGSGIDGATPGATGGAQNVTLARANLPNDSVDTSSGGGHAHYLFANATSNTAIPGSGLAYAAAASTSSPTPAYSIAGVNSPAPTEGGTSLEGAHDHSFNLNGGVTQTVVNKMPPAIVLPFIMRVL